MKDSIRAGLRHKIPGLKISPTPALDLNTHSEQVWDSHGGSLRNVSRNESWLTDKSLVHVMLCFHNVVSQSMRLIMIVFIYNLNRTGNVSLWTHVLQGLDLQH